MATVPVNITGAVDGLGVKIAATATPGTLIHTADIAAQDELWLSVVNTSASAVKLTIEAGGVVDPDNLIEQTIEPEDGLELVIAGHRFTNSKVIRAFASVANVLVIYGNVNRIS